MHSVPLRPPALLHAAVGVLAIGVLYSVFFLLDRGGLARLTDEDGLVENLGAFCFLGAALVLARAGLLVRRAGQPRQGIWLLLLGALMFLCFAEEVSWGQRFLGIETPEAWKQANRQGETNLHNLSFFGSRFTADRLFSLFWFGYCCALPAAAHLLPALRRRVARLGVPLVPLGIGACFLLNHAVQKVLEHPPVLERITTRAVEQEGGGLHDRLGAMGGLRQILEVKEALYGFLFLSAACWFLALGRSLVRAEAPREGRLAASRESR
jgi:hypothetical protein